MIVWDKLTLDTYNFLESKDSSGTEETAEFFASSYHTAMKSSADPMMNTVMINPKSILKSAWLTVFATMLASPKDLKSVPYNIIGTAMIAFWTGAMVSPLIPHPGAVTGTMNVIVFPGNPASVGSGIYNAFQKQESMKVADALVAVYKDHVKGITGLFTGITPAPSPIVVPWTGLN